jgi:hypothetical protein
MSHLFRGNNEIGFASVSRHFTKQNFSKPLFRVHLSAFLSICLFDYMPPCRACLPACLSGVTELTVIDNQNQAGGNQKSTIGTLFGTTIDNQKSEPGRRQSEIDNPTFVWHDNR